MPAHLAVASAPARPVGHAAPHGAANANTAFSSIAAIAERIARLPVPPAAPITAAAPDSASTRGMRPDYLAIDDLSGTDARMRELLARCMPTASGARRHSSPSIRRRCRSISSRASCSDISAAHFPAPFRAG